MMMRRFVPCLLAAAVPALSGCVASMAMSAASLAAQSARGQPVSNEAYQPTAREQCSAQAAQYGAVNVIDVEQHAIDRIIVWGTVGEGAEKRSFQCDFTTKIVGFKLRVIKSGS
jgi:hypothetical protein